MISVKNVYAVISLICFILVINTGFSVTYASISAEGTRIIYPANITSKSFTLTNDDDFPSIVQVWMDDGDILTQPNSAKTSFFVTPSIFRISPHHGQTVKIIHDGSSLPSDRESLFFFNYLQIPSQLAATMSANKNKITLLVRHRLKLFYRPKQIQEDVLVLNKYQRMTLRQDKKSWLLTVYNDSGFYATYADASLVIGDQPAIELDIEMVEPYSSKEIRIQEKKGLPKGEKVVKFSLINDAGGKLSDVIVLDK